MQSGELVCKDKTGRYHPVFKKQGCLDGACATYSVIMNLLILGVISEKDTQINVEHKTKDTRKLFKVFCNDYGMHRNGQTFYKIKRMLKESFSNVVTATHKLTADEESIELTKETLNYGFPVVISVGNKTDDWAHAMLAIGYEENEKGEVDKILCLDPAGDYIHGRKRWNAEIQVKPNQYRLSSVWSGSKTTKIVTLGDVIVINKKASEK